MKNRRTGQGPLQGVERCCCLLRPLERILPQELREGRCDGAKVLDKAAIIASQTQEATQAAGGTRLRPRLHSFHLGDIHGDASF